MSIKATTRQVNGVTVVDINGRITLGEGSSTLCDTVHDLLNRGQKTILLNLGEVTFVDSPGLAALVICFARVTKQGGQLKLLSVTKRMHALLQISKLLTVFDVQDDETAGIHSFS